MNLKQVKKHSPKKKRSKRVGRGSGSGRGLTCGRGHKGAKSRSGWGGKVLYEGGQMPLVRRIRTKGFNNKFRAEFTEVNLSRLEGFSEGEQITPEKLIMAGIIKKVGRNGIKILGSGDAVKSAEVVAHRFTAGARAKIEAAGGKCVFVDDLKAEKAKEPGEIR